MGLTGLDFAADIRDLAYDFSNWEWTGKHIGQTLLDLVGLIPGIGVVKNIDEAAGLVKNAIKNSDASEHIVKKALDNVDEVMPELKRSMDSEQITSLLGNVMKSSDEGAGVAKGGYDSTKDIITDGTHLQKGKLDPDVRYKTGEHNYVYKTNENGLIVNASTNSLQLKTHMGRLNHNINTYGKEIEDNAGHLIGDRFGGSPELDNLVSQARKVNLSEFKMIENQWAKALKNRQKVTVDININYDAGSIRPSSFDVSYTIDAVPFFQSIIN